MIITILEFGRVLGGANIRAVRHVQKTDLLISLKMSQKLVVGYSMSHMLAL